MRQLWKVLFDSLKGHRKIKKKILKRAIIVSDKTPNTLSFLNYF
jgi:hypothetical protein